MALRKWLLEKSATHIGMVGTGACWQPSNATLEAAFTVIVGNVSHMRDVPDRKTDAE